MPWFSLSSPHEFIINKSLEVNSNTTWNEKWGLFCTFEKCFFFERLLMLLEQSSFIWCKINTIFWSGKHTFPFLVHSVDLVVQLQARQRRTGNTNCRPRPVVWPCTFSCGQDVLSCRFWLQVTQWISIILVFGIFIWGWYWEEVWRVNLQTLYWWFKDKKISNWSFQVLEKKQSDSRQDTKLLD